MENGSSFVRGFQRGLAGDMAGAVEAFERGYRQNANSPALGAALLDAYLEANRLSDAQALGAELLARWPEHATVRATMAALREREGRVDEALTLLRGPGVDFSAASNEYPLYLRLLVETGRYAEAASAAEAGLESLWRVHALLARAVASLHAGDDASAASLLDEIDAGNFAELLGEWVESLRRARALDAVGQLLTRSTPALERSATLRRLRALVAGRAG